MSTTITPLCILGYKYGTDKCPQIKHSYTPAYYHLFNPRKRAIKKVLEIGIGSTRPNFHIPEKIYKQGISPKLKRGSSLYMWRDFFPNALVYGADIKATTLFQDERITTYVCDEKIKEDIEQLITLVGSDVDIVIDDASHHVADQIFLAQTLLPFLQKKVVYVIEDVSHSRALSRVLSKDYNTQVIDVPRKWHGGMLYVITKKS